MHPTSRKNASISRRQFLHVSALAGGGLLITTNIAPAVALAKPLSLNRENIPSRAQLAFFLAVQPDNKVLFRLTKHEMGQGVSTGLAAIIADEADIDWENLTVEWIPDDTRFNFGTGGSTTIADLWLPLRKAGATAREMLIQTAAKRWNVTPSECHAEKSFVIHRNTNKRFSFGELATEASSLPMPTTINEFLKRDVPLKAANKQQLIGKALAHKAVPDIVRGKYAYGIDVRLNGMVYAVIARCPVYRGKLIRYDATKALLVPGVRRVIPIRCQQTGSAHFPFHVREGVAVIATSTWAAIQGRKALTIEWNDGPNAKHDTESWQSYVAERSNEPTTPVGYSGDEQALKDVAQVDRILTATYTYPYQHHMLMEPLNCVAQIQENGATLWLGTQGTEYVRGEAAQLLGIAPEAITINLYPSGGGFGRRFYPDMALEALVIAKQMGNAPVKVMNTREDEVRTNFAHFYHQGIYRAGITNEKTLYAWYLKELRTYWGREGDAPELMWNGYAIANVRYDRLNLQTESLIQSCAWRSVVANPWAMGQECFLDEIAHELKLDPLDLRLKLLADDREVDVGHSHKISSLRLRRVLALATQKAGYGKELPKGYGQGIAVYPYLHGNAYCAVVAEVVVEKGEFRLLSITCGVDCGRVVNPNLVTQQIQGGVVWALNALRYGGIDFRKGQVTSSNYHDKPVLRMPECPPIHVHFVDDADERPWGVGELSPPPTVPAVLNALFKATGKRIRHLPVTKNDLSL